MFGYFLSAVYSVAVTALFISSVTAEGKGGGGGGGGGSILKPARAFHFTRHYCHIA